MSEVPATHPYYLSRGKYILDSLAKLGMTSKRVSEDEFVYDTLADFIWNTIKRQVESAVEDEKVLWQFEDSILMRNKWVGDE